MSCFSYIRRGTVGNGHADGLRSWQIFFKGATHPRHRSQINSYALPCSLMHGTTCEQPTCELIIAIVSNASGREAFLKRDILTALRAAFQNSNWPLDFWDAEGIIHPKGRRTPAQPLMQTKAFNQAFPRVTTGVGVSPAALAVAPTTYLAPTPPAP